MKSTNTDPLQKLLAMPMKQRLNAVAKDLRARREKFKSIDPFELAEALGVPNPENPGDGWWFAHYAQRVTAEDYASNCDGAAELICRLENKVPAKRFKVLLGKSEQFDNEGGKKFAFLRSKERKLLEDELTPRELERNRDNGMNCIARCRLKASLGKVLWFEGSIERGPGGPANDSIKTTRVPDLKIRLAALESNTIPPVARAEPIR